MNHRLTRAEAEARRILAEAKAELQALGEPWDGYRVDVELIAVVKFGLWVQRADLQVGQRNYAAFLNAQARLIAVEESHHEHRQRFSIAHELGHYVLHTCAKEDQDFFTCTPEDMEVVTDETPEQARRTHLRQEWEANLFAGELLMPEAPLLAMFRATGGRITAMAKHFNVSPQALEIRLSRLDLPFQPVLR